MFAAGSNESATPKRSAVAGISCINPRAPFFETSRGSKSDSVLITAETSAASTSNLFAAAMMIAFVHGMSARDVCGCTQALDRLALAGNVILGIV